MTEDDIKTAEDLIGSIYGPDAEDCERFTSRYGHTLLKIARQQLHIIEALKTARYGLTVSNNLRATDLDPQTFEAHLNNGVPRDTIEWTIDNMQTLTIIDAVLP